jgi:hemolysin III
MRRIVCGLKEPFCAVSHFIGAGLSVVGLIVLLALSRGRLWHLVSFAIYGVSMILLYLASAFYHSLPATRRIGPFLRRLDHSAIYLLIVGAYTPVCLLSLRGAWGWGLLSAVYALAIPGILISLFRKRAPRALRITLTVVMGWLVAIAIGPLRRALPASALLWLLYGGLAYSVGAIIYAVDRPHLWPGKFSAHDLWHLFVLGGSACHYYMMVRFIALSP